MLPSEEAPRIIQQIEIIQMPIRIDEHRGLAYWCKSCQKVHYAPLPPEVQKGGLFGPQLTAVVAYMKGMCHASFSTGATGRPLYRERPFQDVDRLAVGI